MVYAYACMECEDFASCTSLPPMVDIAAAHSRETGHEVNVCPVEGERRRLLPGLTVATLVIVVILFGSLLITSCGSGFDGDTTSILDRNACDTSGTPARGTGNGRIDEPPYWTERCVHEITADVRYGCNGLSWCVVLYEDHSTEGFCGGSYTDEECSYHGPGNGVCRFDCEEHE